MQFNTLITDKQYIMNFIKFHGYDKNRAHNPKVGGSIPPFATKGSPSGSLFSFTHEIQPPDVHTRALPPPLRRPVYPTFYPLPA